MNIVQFKSSEASRSLLLTLIDFLDLSVKDPERWPALETILYVALQQPNKEQIHGLKATLEAVERGRESDRQERQKLQNHITWMQTIGTQQVETITRLRARLAQLEVEA